MVYQNQIAAATRTVVRSGLFCKQFSTPMARGLAVAIGMQSTKYSGKWQNWREETPNAKSTLETIQHYYNYPTIATPFCVFLLHFCF